MDRVPHRPILCVARISSRDFVWQPSDYPGADRLASPNNYPAGSILRGVSSEAFSSRDVLKELLQPNTEHTFL